MTINLNNTSVGKISEITAVCQKIYFRIPGEHIIDDMKYDMEIQIYCKVIVI
jgi:hypothetical protein